MATQKPGEWANSLLSRFEEQVYMDSHTKGRADVLYIWQKSRRTGQIDKICVHHIYICISSCVVVW